MKLFAFFITALSCSGIAQLAKRPAPEPPTPEELKNVPTVDLAQLRDKQLYYEGKFIRLRFTHRSADVSEAGGSLQGSIYYYEARRRDWVDLYVTIPTDGRESFLKLNPHNTGRSYFLYGRISKSATTQYATIFGRELRTGLKGAELIW